MVTKPHVRETWRVDPELHERIRKAASEDERSINYQITRAVKEFLDRRSEKQAT